MKKGLLYLILMAITFTLSFFQPGYATNVGFISLATYVNTHEISRKKLSSIPYYVSLISEDLQAYHDIVSIFDGYLNDNEFELEVGPPIQRVTHDADGSIYIIMEDPITAGSQGKTIELVPYSNSSNGTMIFASLECTTDLTQPLNKNAPSTWTNSGVSALLHTFGTTCQFDADVTDRVPAAL